MQTSEIDRIAAERDTYKHAFETTSADRDRIAAELEALQASHQSMAASYSQLKVRGYDLARDAHTHALLPYTLILNRPKAAGMYVRAVIEHSNIVGRCEHAHALAPKSIARLWAEHPWSRDPGHGSMTNALAVMSHKRALAKLGLDVPAAVVIYIARDPIERACSDYFFFTARPEGNFSLEGTQRANKITASQLSLAMERFDWKRDDDFLREEFDEYLGVAPPSLSQAGPWKVVDGEGIRALFIRGDGLDTLWDALTNLYGYPITRNPIDKTNTSEDNGYAEAYRKAIAGIRLMPEMIEEALSTRFAKTFFSDADRARLSRKWTR